MRIKVCTRIGCAICGRRLDWLVAAMPALLAGGVYLCSMPPSVPMYVGAYVTAGYGIGHHATHQTTIDPFAFQR